TALDAAQTADAPGVAPGAGLQPAWGLYSNGQAVIIAESVVSFGFKVDWAISTYPIERGGFESYDRVATPFLAHVQFAAGSTKEKRLALLESLGQASADGNMTKYDVFTPEVIYTSVSIQHFDYDRKAAEGANLLKIDVF